MNSLGGVAHKEQEADLASAAPEGRQEILA